MGVLPHIIWAPSSRSSCCLLPQSPLCAPRPIRLSPTPPATTSPTPTGLPSPTTRPRPPSSPTPTLPLSTLLLPDARTMPVLWCLVLTVVSFPSESFQLLPLLRSLLWRRQGRRGRPRPSLKPILKLRPMPGTSTAPTATGPMATATLPTATLLTPTPVTMATMGWATTTATTAGRRGRRPLRLMPMLLPRPTPGCCMVLTVTDLHMEATTATATPTPPTPTLEAAVTISVVLSPVPLAGREERRCEQKIKIDSLEPCFNFSFRVHPKSLSKHRNK